MKSAVFLKSGGKQKLETEMICEVEISNVYNNFPILLF